MNKKIIISALLISSYAHGQQFVKDGMHDMQNIVTKHPQRTAALGMLAGSTLYCVAKRTVEDLRYSGEGIDACMLDKINRWQRAELAGAVIGLSSLAVLCYLAWQKYQQPAAQH